MNFYVPANCPCRIALVAILGLLAPLAALSAEPLPATLETKLLAMDAKQLAKAARQSGDATRGAVLFHLAHVACSKCHATGQAPSALGPDLSDTKALQKQLPRNNRLDEHIVTSILRPSQHIAKEFQAEKIQTTAGKTLVGFIKQETPRTLSLRDAVDIGKTIEIPVSEIEQRVKSRVSVMPVAMVNQLRDQQQFLDLVRYTLEVAEHGAKRARELDPDPKLLAAATPEFVDHAKIIPALNNKSLLQGQKLFVQYCVNCHGVDGNKVINPLARRFALDKLKFGSDPYSMWKTITWGNGLMFPQAALLSPEDRYNIVHYLRERLIRDQNPDQYFSVDSDYLAKINVNAAADALKLGGSRRQGPLAAGMIDGSMGKQMNYGPYLSHSLAFRKPSNNDAGRFEETTERALLVKLPGDLIACYDTERLSVSGLWRGRLGNTKKTHHTSYKGSTCLAPGGKVLYQNIDDAGWAVGSLKQPATFADGNVRFLGHYLHGQQVLLKYRVGGREIAELPSGVAGGHNLVSRTLRIGAGKKTLYCLVGRLPKGQATATKLQAQLANETASISVEIRGETDSLQWIPDEQGGLWLRIPASQDARTCTVWTLMDTVNGTENINRIPLPLPATSVTPDLQVLKQGGPRRWSQSVTLSGTRGESVNGYALDEFPVPFANPWGSWMRTTAVDFFRDGTAAVATLSGDVWLVRWNNEDLKQVTWSRFATGLYEPLGLRIVDDNVYVRGRDRITKLHDVNNDGEADWYECFYQSGEIGAGYHAFIFDLQTDREGNFYFSKSGRKSPHEGGVVRLSPEGKQAELICRDFRHPNGMGAGGPHNWITVSDNPHGKAVYNGVAIVREGQRYGYSGERTTPMLAVLPPTVDSSSGGQCWTDETRFGPLNDTLIHTSYSRLSVFYVLTQNLSAHPNGFAIRFDFPFHTGVMRPRVNPADGQLYVVGQKGWDTQAPDDGGLYRIRYVPKTARLIDSVKATKQGLELSCTTDLKTNAISVKNVAVLREDEKETRPIKLAGVRVLGPRQIAIDLPDIAKEVVEHRSRLDKKTGLTTVSVLAPIRVTVNLPTVESGEIKQVIYATVNSLP